jgi:hypothetical protein
MLLSSVRRDAHIRATETIRFSIFGTSPISGPSGSNRTKSLEFMDSTKVGIKTPMPVVVPD